MQKRYHIVSIGSVLLKKGSNNIIYGMRVVALTLRSGNREVLPTHFAISWGIGCHFLAVKKN